MGRCYGQATICSSCVVDAGFVLIGMISEVPGGVMKKTLALHSVSSGATGCSCNELPTVTNSQIMSVR